jgi:predicted CoA-binding protein
MPPNSRSAIDAFLALRRIAFVGLSSNPKDFSRHVYHAFLERGYDVVPVNPKISEVESRACYSRIADIVPRPEGAVVMTAPAASAQIVRECAEAGLKHVWLHRGAGKGAVSAEAVEAANKDNLNLVAGECPFMFLSGDQLPHNIHRWIRKVTFSYPK